MSEKSKLPDRLPDHDIARREQALAEIDHEELVSRAKNQAHLDLLTEVAVTRWMQEHPEHEADPLTLQLIREDAQATKQQLEEFEANNYQYPEHPEQP